MRTEARHRTDSTNNSTDSSGEEEENDGDDDEEEEKTHSTQSTMDKLEMNEDDNYENELDSTVHIDPEEEM